MSRSSTPTREERLSVAESLRTTWGEFRVETPGPGEQEAPAVSIRERPAPEKDRPE